MINYEYTWSTASTAESTRPTPMRPTGSRLAERRVRPAEHPRARRIAWQGHNPHVTEANVRALDMANGGGGRFASAPPRFRSVQEYEGNRVAAPTMFASGNSSSSPRRGFFGRFFGR